MKKGFILALTCLGAVTAFAQPTPPAGKKWVKVENMSDEFNNTDGVLNTSKWVKTAATGWVGRAPGLFIDDAISVNGGFLRITNSKLSAPVIKNGATFTHGCGLVASKNSIVNGYFECRMRANKTFMSSTFWLINNLNEGTGCNKRTVEIDITETVGFKSGTGTWIDDFIGKMNSNTHSRNVTCTTTPVAIVGNGKTLGNKSYDGYHLYGAWWKSKTEILFYLDGKYAYTVKPPSDFDLPMYLRMVTETYDWNPVPSGGGMTGSFYDRSTYYDWVHTFRLENTSKMGVTGKESIDEETSTEANFYPNPAKDFVTVAGVAKGDLIVIKNITGTAVLSVLATTASEQIDVSALKSGVYFIIVADKLNAKMVIK